MLSVKRLQIKNNVKHYNAKHSKFDIIILVKQEMCPYDTDAPAQRAILTDRHFAKKRSWNKGHNSHNNWRILP